MCVCQSGMCVYSLVYVYICIYIYVYSLPILNMKLVIHKDQVGR